MLLCAKGKILLKNDKTDFTQGRILPKLAFFMLPILGALVLQAAYGAVDLLVVGRFGSTSGLSAVSTGIRDYLNGLQWDGTERIAHVLHHFLGAAEDEYTCEAMKIFLLGAVKRVFQPGCKFETMLCLVGGQGCGSPVATSKCCKHFEAPTEPTGETGKVQLFSAVGGQG